MQKLLQISDAASLALHAAATLAANPEERASTRQMAQLLEASEAHLAKVMQRLVHTGLVTSVRGPGGGFTLARPADEITLMHVFEAIEGPFQPSTCLLARPACNGTGCLLGGMLAELNTTFEDYFRQHTLADLAPGTWLTTLKQLPQGKTPATPSADH